MALTNTLAGRNLGMVLLAIWLILTGLLPLLNVRITAIQWRLSFQATLELSEREKLWLGLKIHAKT